MVKLKILTQWNHIDWANLTPVNLYEVISGPTLIHIKGINEVPLFISVLLHGNETTSFYVLQYFALKYLTRTPPRSLIFFIGHPQAAKQSLRQLEDGIDFNRIWSVSLPTHLGSHHHLAEEVISYVHNYSPLACIDIHNNSGENPIYACIGLLEKDFFSLATLFSDRLVYFTHPKECLSQVFSSICPSVTLECGNNENVEGKRKAIEMIETLLVPQFSFTEQRKKTLKEYSLFHTIGRLYITSELPLDFQGNLTPGEGISFEAHLEQFNFTQLNFGHVLAFYSPTIPSSFPFKILSNFGQDLTDQYLSFEGSKVIIKRSIYPCMLTTNQTIIRSDCLGHLMEKIHIKFTD